MDEEKTGAQLLDQWLYRHWQGSTCLAEKLGVHRSRISQISRGKGNPSITLALAIEKETGIDAGLFVPIIATIRTEAIERYQRVVDEGSEVSK